MGHYPLRDANIANRLARFKKLTREQIANEGNISLCSKFLLADAAVILQNLTNPYPPLKGDTLKRRTWIEKDSSREHACTLYGITLFYAKTGSHRDLDPNMVNSAKSSETVESDSADTVTRNLYSLGRQRSRGRRLMRLAVALIALAITATILGNIYLETLEPGFEWTWPD